MGVAVPVPVLWAVLLPDEDRVAVSVPLDVEAAVAAAVQDGEGVGEAV